MNVEPSVKIGNHKALFNLFSTEKRSYNNNEMFQKITFLGYFCKFSTFANEWFYRYSKMKTSLRSNLCIIKKIGKRTRFVSDIYANVFIFFEHKE